MAIKKSPKHSRTNILLTAIIVILLATSTYYYVKFKTATPTSLQKTRFQACSISGHLPKEDYLPIYLVKKGDTLLSISRDQLQDTNRVDEIIKLNKSTHPELSLTTPYIEPGWKLTLPPQNSPRTNGLIYVVAGRVSVSQIGWGINWPNASIGSFQLSQLPSSISNGDCAIVTYQGNDIKNPSELKVFSVIKEQ